MEDAYKDRMINEALEVLNSDEPGKYIEALTIFRDYLHLENRFKCTVCGNLTVIWDISMGCKECQNDTFETLIVRNE